MNVLNDTDKKILRAYWDTMCRPLNFHSSGRIPDGLAQNSTSLVDFYDNTNVITPLNESDSTIIIQGMGCFLTFGQNMIQNNTYNLFSGDAMTGALYSIVYFYINVTGQIILWDSTTVSEDDPVLTSKGIIYNKETKKYETKFEKIKEEKHKEEEEKKLTADATAAFWGITPTNYETITGSEFSVDTGNALISQMRLVGAGFRVLPTIELVTDSSTFAISRNFTFSCTPTALYDVYYDGGNVYSFAQDSLHYGEYTNAEGVTCRVDPWQEGALSLTTMQPLPVWNNDNFNTNNMMFPAWCCKLTSNLSIEVGTTGTLPIRITTRYYWEATLRAPTPILSDKVARVPMVVELSKAVAYDTVNYPLCTKGHTFPEVTMAVFKTLASLDPRYRLLAKTATTFYSAYRNYHLERHAGNDIKADRLARKLTALEAKVKKEAKEIKKVKKKDKPKKKPQNVKRGANPRVGRGRLRGTFGRRSIRDPNINNYGINRAIRVRPDIDVLNRRYYRNFF